MTAFAVQLRANIRAYIVRAKLDGIVAMGIDNLRQVVQSPSPNLDGAPRGTNAIYYYDALFREVCANERDIANFIAGCPTLAWKGGQRERS
jgi:hypothetical protein